MGTVSYTGSGAAVAPGTVSYTGSAYAVPPPSGGTVSYAGSAQARAISPVSYTGSAHAVPPPSGGTVSYAGSAQARAISPISYAGSGYARATSGGEYSYAASCVAVAITPISYKASAYAGSDPALSYKASAYAGPVAAISYKASALGVVAYEKSYTASVVTPPGDRSYTAAIFAIRIREKDYTGNLWMFPEEPAGTKDIGHNANVYCYQLVEREKAYDAAVYAATQYLGLEKAYTAAVNAVVLHTYDQTYRGAVYVSAKYEKYYTANLIKALLNVELSYTASVNVITPTVVSYTAAVAMQQQNIDRSYTASVRPYIAISDAEQAVRDEAINEMILYTNEYNINAAQMAVLTARQGVLTTELAELLAIVNAFPITPSSVLHTIYPTSAIPRTGGVPLSLSGADFIPGAVVRLFQDVTTLATVTANVVTQSVVEITLPDFTGIGATNFALPVSVRLENPTGAVTEALMFTFASA
jgi:hypothetical protein